MAAQNDIYWYGGSVVLLQSAGTEPDVYWYTGSVIFDYIYEAGAPSGSAIPVFMSLYRRR